MNWSDFFEYTDGQLIWKVRPSNRIKIGSIAGCITLKGYLVVRLNNKLYFCHRVIWEMHNGPIPEGYEIDHINHIRTDNHIQNLRIVHSDENSRNKSRYQNNSSGVTGVSWSRQSQKWYAQIQFKGKNISLGYFNKFSEAVKARKQAEDKYYFHENHGK